MAISRPVFYGGLAVFAVALWVWSAEEPVPAKKPKKPVAAKKKVEEQSAYTDADYVARFAKPVPKARNLFMPAVLPPQPKALPGGVIGTTTVAVKPPEDILRIPADLADGDGNWQYTGFVMVNNQSMALLENTGDKTAGYVQQGQVWKKTKVLRITRESLVLAGKEGKPVTVLRFNPELAKKLAEAVKPLDPSSAMQGVINPNNIQIVPSGPGGMPGRPRGMNP